MRDATEYGATAQRGGDGGITLIPEPSMPGDSTLNVNVFTPVAGDPDAALPVLVYIHGGGYIGGSPASPWYDGRAFNRDGVVTVTISYRLGFDGFGYIAGAPSNRGVRDWLPPSSGCARTSPRSAATPARVTIAGQSAGGGAVLTLLGMPAAQHLFHAVWALSGATRRRPAERARTLSARLADLAGVAPTREGFGTLVPEEINSRAARTRRYARRAGPASTGVRGAAGGRAVVGAGDRRRADHPDRRSRRSRAGVGADKPLVLGATDDEFTMVTDGVPKGKLRFVPAALALGRVGRRCADPSARVPRGEPRRSGARAPPPCSAVT